MITFSGVAVSQDNDGVPTQYDVGVALGRIPRFAGMTHEWFPVLGHVLTVARLLPGRIAIHGLMHDAAEAVVSDVPTPWKTEAARDLEHSLLERIYRGWGVALPSEEDWAEVYKADREALVAEAHVLGHANTTGWADDPNPLVMDVTAAHLEMCRPMIEAANAGPIYQEAFDAYLALSKMPDVIFK